MAGFGLMLFGQPLFQMLNKPVPDMVHEPLHKLGADRLYGGVGAIHVRQQAQHVLDAVRCLIFLNSAPCNRCTELVQCAVLIAGGLDVSCLVLILRVLFQEPLRSSTTDKCYTPS